ncbi:hypothetical protein G6F55_014067 [Rhizopus delemar]|nr:hypothetical protein G6F55_014067 [Rhizopus delemar]
MSLELRQGTADVAPFGEALAPPGIVLFERMELRQPIARSSARSSARAPSAAAPTRPRGGGGLQLPMRAKPLLRRRSRSDAGIGRARNSARSTEKLSWRMPDAA